MKINSVLALNIITIIVIHIGLYYGHAVEASRTVNRDANAIRRELGLLLAYYRVYRIAYNNISLRQRYNYNYIAFGYRKVFQRVWTMKHAFEHYE